MMKSNYSPPYFAFCLLLLFASPLCGQTQYTLCPSVLNPSTMGAEKDLSFALLVQHRLTGFENAPKTAFFNAVLPIGFKKDRRRYSQVTEKSFFVGLSVEEELINIHQHLQAHLLLGYRLKLSKELKLTLGLSTGMDLRTSNYGRLSYPDGYSDPLLNTQIATSPLAFQAKVGAFLQGRNFQVSFFMPALLNSPIYGLQGTWHTKEGHFEIHSLTMYEPKQKKGTQNITLFGMFTKSFGIGIAWENPKDLSAILKIKIKKITISYAFHIPDFNPNKMGHELGMKVGIGRK